MGVVGSGREVVEGLRWIVGGMLMEQRRVIEECIVSVSRALRYQDHFDRLLECFVSGGGRKNGECGY